MSSSESLSELDSSSSTSSDEEKLSKKQRLSGHEGKVNIVINLKTG